MSMDSRFSLSDHGSSGVPNEHTETITDEGEDIFSWLSTLEPQKQHSCVSRSRLKGVGGWFLETAEFRSWRDDDSEFVGQILFCQGVPGAGKTFISSLAIDNLSDISDPSRAKIGVSYIYNDYRNQKYQDPAGIMGGLLKQLVAGLPDIPEITQAFQEAKECLEGQDSLLPTILNLFPSIIASFGQVFMFIDAWDEFSAETRFKLSHSLCRVMQGSPKTRLLLTGRPRIRPELDGYFAKPIVSVTIQPIPDDIEMFSRWKLDQDLVPDHMDDDLRLEITAQIHKLPKIFLLAAIYIDAILGERTVIERRKMLRRVPARLDDAYSLALERISKQREEKAQLGIAVLMWISFTERPLLVDELCDVLSIEIGATDLIPDNVPPVQTLLDCCLGLVTVDRESSVIRTTHTTLMEYLSNHPELFEKAHSRIAEICLTYLNLRRIEDFSPTLPSPPSTAPFLQYASSYWGTHAKVEITENVKSLALQLLGMYPNHVSASLFLRDSGYYPEEEVETITRTVTGLHCAAFFGLTEIAIALLGMESTSVNPRDGNGCTPLVWAARRGYEEVVQLLLDSPDADASSMGDDGRTPLHWAAANGYDGIVKLLLKRDEVNPDSLAIDDRTPLFCAVIGGHESVVKLLLAWGGVDLGVKSISPNSFDRFGRTPLSWASGSGQERMVEALLGRQGIDPNMADNDSRTPLSWAAGNGHKGVMERLLRHDAVIPSEADNDNRTPLSWAAGNGHEAAMRLLLERENVDLKALDDHGRTPLSWAAGNGHKAAVEILLSQPGVDPNQEDHEGQTPLFWATLEEREVTVRVLLDCMDVYPNFGNTKQRTPLSWAAEHGYGAVVKLLLNREDIDPSEQDGSGRAPLSWAAGNGHEEVVKLLLSCEGTALDTLDGHDQTPLFWAVRNGREEIVSLLLQPGVSVNPNIGDDQERTPLFWAVEHGHEGLVELLLGRQDTDPNFEANHDRTPLLCAAESGNEEILKLLLARIDIDLNLTDDRGRTPLFCAVQNKHEGVVRLLLERQKIDPNAKDIDDRTPLSWAAENGYEDMVDMILGHGEVDPNLGDKLGQTPLLWASKNGHEAIVKALLGRNANPNLTDDDNRTPLSRAAEAGHEGVVKLFLGSDVDPNLQSSDKRTPLHWATLQGHGEIVKLLLGRKGISPNTADLDQRAPLSWAVEKGFEEITNLLLCSEDIDPNLIDGDKRSPLSYAAESGRNSIVARLLNIPDVLPNIKDSSGMTPILWATLNQHEEAVRLLLQNRDVDPGSLDIWGYSPLALASKKGHEGIVKLLLDREDIEPNSEDNHRRTPFFWACLNGHEGIVRLLLDHNKINPYLVDRYNRSPAEWAEENDHTQIVDLFKVRGVCIRPFPGPRRLSEFPPKSTSLVAGPAGKQAPVEGYGDRYNRNPLLTQEGCQKLVNAPFIHQLNTDSPEGYEMPLLSEGDNNDNEMPSKVGKRVDKWTLSKSKPTVHLDIMLATRLIQSSLDVLQKASNRNRSRHLGRFKLWADEYGTPHGQLDEILKESPILKEATVTLLADLCNILTTGTSHLDDILHKERFSALQDACTIYPGVSQLFTDTDSDSGCEKDEIETIVDSLFDLSPLLVDILENFPTDVPTGAGNSGEATAVSEAVCKFDASAYARRVRVSRLFLLGCLLLVHQMADHTGRFLMTLENLRRDWLK